MSITDVHCHILPGIDDGSKDLDMSIQMLYEEHRQGVNNIVFTPHFYVDSMSLDDFVQRRDEAFRLVLPVCEDLGINVKTGAEVKLSPALFDTDLSSLAFDGTRYILTEWPFDFYPPWGDEMIEHIIEQGYTPIFAHIERYGYMMKNPFMIRDYIKQGCLIQANAHAYLGHHARPMFSLLKSGAIHLLGSDAHNMDSRRPDMESGIRQIAKKSGNEVVMKLIRNGEDVFDNTEY